jgi:predicted GNAT family N-acyltransferase
MTTPATRHFGAYDRGRLVGVATFFAEPCPVRPGLGPGGCAAWQRSSRSNAGEPAVALVAEGIRVASADGRALVWCNARVGARGFYEKVGFVAVGDEFELPDSGTHFVMTRENRPTRVR